MKQATKAILLKYARLTHGWLGFMVLPWILMIGFTGFYLNHSKLILNFIYGPPFDETQFVSWPTAHEITTNDALVIAQAIWPEEAVDKIKQEIYHKRDSIYIYKDSGYIIVSKATGHYYVKTTYTRKTYSPDGYLLDSKFYWGTLFKVMHTRGWFTTKLGTWLADIVSIALIVFAFTGIFLWWMPRAKKIKRKLGILRNQ